MGEGFKITFGKHDGEAKMPLCPSKTTAIKNGEAAAATAVDESGPFITIDRKVDG